METVEEEVSEPVSPTGQYLSSSVLSLSIIAVLELEVPFDESQTMSLVKNVFLPINPRFSSIMVAGKNGVKYWKRVEVKLEDHVHVPNFPTGMPTKFYDQVIDDYLSQMATKQLPQSHPLWEIHVLNCPTSDAAANLIFKLHHSLGELRSTKKLDRNSSAVYRPCRGVPKFLCCVFNCVSDSCKSSCLIWDHNSPIRSGVCSAEVAPVSITTITLSIDVIKQIKTKLGVSVTAAVISYAGKLRVAMLVEKGLIDTEKLKSHVQDAFDMIKNAALENSSPI